MINRPKDVMRNIWNVKTRSICYSYHTKCKIYKLQIFALFHEHLLNQQYSTPKKHLLYYIKKQHNTHWFLHSSGDVYSIQGGSVSIRNSSERRFVRWLSLIIEDTNNMDASSSAGAQFSTKSSCEGIVEETIVMI